MPRLAIVIPNLVPFGGAERVMLALGVEISKLGVTTDYVFRNEGEDLSAHIGDSRHINAGVSRLRDFVGPLTRYLKTEKPDAVLTAMWPLTVLTLIAHRLARSSARIVVSDHSFMTLQYADWGLAHRLALRASMAATYRLADARVAVSAGVADDLARLSGIARDRFAVIHNPLYLPSEVKDSSPSAEALWRGGAGRRILNVGSLKTQKNQALAIRAFARMPGNEEARLMVLGEGPLRPELEALAREEGVADRVILPGFFSDPRDFYRSADVFMLSSDYEGFGNVIIEAMAYGLPVVSTDCLAGPSEILEDGRYGQLVPVGDEAALAGAMAQALAAPHDPDAQRARAAEFAPDRVAQAYRRLLFPDFPGRGGPLVSEGAR